MNWHKIENKKPIASQLGNWDGLKSDKILVVDKNRNYHICQMYQGVLDGNEFCDFYDDFDFEVTNVAFWIELDMPF